MVDANAMDAVEVVGVRFAIVHTRRHVMFTPPLRSVEAWVSRDSCADLSQKKNYAEPLKKQHLHLCIAYAA